MHDGQTGHVDYVRTHRTGIGKMLQSLKKAEETCAIIPGAPGWVIQAAEPEQVMDFLRMQLHGRRGKKPQTGEQSPALHLLKKIEKLVGFSLVEYAPPGSVRFIDNHQVRKRQNSRICFSLSLPVIVGHLFLWRPLL